VNLALETAINLKAGACWVNCHNLFDAAAGFGGYRESGYGRDGGKEVWMLRALSVLSCTHNNSDAVNYYLKYCHFICAHICLLFFPPSLPSFPPLFPSSPLLPPPHPPPLQGLYEYAKPAWQERPRPKVDEEKVKTFGQNVAPRPLNPAENQLQLYPVTMEVDGVKAPRYVLWSTYEVPVSSCMNQCPS